PQGDVVPRPVPKLGRGGQDRRQRGFGQSGNSGGRESGSGRVYRNPQQLRNLNVTGYPVERSSGLSPVPPCSQPISDDLSESCPDHGQPGNDSAAGTRRQETIGR